MLSKPSLSQLVIHIFLNRFLDLTPVFSVSCSAEGDEYLADLSDPHKFFRCSFGKAIEFICAEGTVFDELTSNCNFEKSQ